MRIGQSTLAALSVPQGIESENVAPGPPQTDPIPITTPAIARFLLQQARLAAHGDSASIEFLPGLIPNHRRSGEECVD
jgi:hypothetical protein